MAIQSHSITRLESVERQ